MTVSAPPQADAPYQVQFVTAARPWWWRALFPCYAVLSAVFMVWRCTIVNWHVWTGPLSLFVDDFGALTFAMLLWQVRHPSVPSHRAVDVSTRVVDCLIPTHTEPAEVVMATVIGALRIRGVRRVLVLGNRFRPEMQDMAVRLGAEYHCRDAMEYGKAGNLNAGMRHTDAEFFITLDADHIPRPDLLERTLGYFDDPAVALVQAPQAYYNTDSFTFRRSWRWLWSECQMFYRNVQPSKNHWNASFYVGTSAVLRRRAVVETGGFGTGTVTEDIHTALRMHSQGWRTVFLPEPVAFGLEAASLKEFYSQRRRWAVGSLQLLLRHRDSPLRRRGLTAAQRVHYVHATTVHFTGPQRLFQLALPAITMFTLVSPVRIPIGGYALAFIGYVILSWLMVALHFGRSYHPLHSEGYSLTAALSQTAALAALFRRERRYKAANKRVNPRERTWVKTALRLLFLVCLATVVDGAWHLGRGDANGLVISATVWSGLHGLWIGSVLAYLLRYERRPAPHHEALTGEAKYDWVMAHTTPQVETARAYLATVDPVRAEVAR